MLQREQTIRRNEATLFCSQDGGNSFLQTVRNTVPDVMMLRHRNLNVLQCKNKTFVDVCKILTRSILFFFWHQCPRKKMTVFITYHVYSVSCSWCGSSWPNIASLSVHVSLRIGPAAGAVVLGNLNPICHDNNG